MKQSQRSKRLSELIQRNLALTLIYYRDNPLLSQVTLTGVEVAADLATAKIFVDILNEESAPAVLKELQQEGHNLRRSLARSLNLRKTPHLTFIHDKSVVKGQKLSAIINAAVDTDEKIHQQLQEQENKGNQKINEEE